MTRWRYDDEPDYDPAAYLKWRAARWRARRAVYVADLDHRRHATPATAARVDRATQHLRQIEAGRP